MALDYLTVDHLSTKDLIRVFSKIEIHPDLQHNNTPCWIWFSSRNPSGYGLFLYKRKQLAAHRVLYAWLISPLPKGYKNGEIDHLCKRPSCCNPCHLELVPRQVNQHRGDGFAGKNARKTSCPHGHLLSGKNLLVAVNGKRRCRTCKNEQQRKKQLWRQPHIKEAARLRKQRYKTAKLL